MATVPAVPAARPARVDLRGKGPVRAKTRIETDYLPDDDAAKARLRKVLDVEPLLDDEGDVDSFELLRRVARQKPVFLGDVGKGTSRRRATRRRSSPP